VTSIDPEARKYALLILMHLCLDDTVISDAATFMLTQDTIEAMMRFIPDRHPMVITVQNYTHATANFSTVE
jgi:hypothetical protein